MPYRLINIDVFIEKHGLDDIFPDLKSIELYKKQIQSIFKDNHLKGKVKVMVTYQESSRMVNKA